MDFIQCKGHYSLLYFLPYFYPKYLETITHYHTSGLEVIKLFSCSTQLSIKFSLLINIKMQTIVGIFIFISREISCLAMFSKKEFAIVSNLRLISRTNFMLS